MDSLIGRNQFCSSAEPPLRPDQFALHFSDFQPNLDEVNHRLENPLQITRRDFCFDMSSNLALLAHKKLVASTRLDVDVSDAPTETTPATPAAACDVHLRNSRFLRSVRTSLPMDRCWENNAFTTDFAPFLAHVNLLEQKRSIECPKRRFFHYLDTIQYPQLDNSFSHEGNRNTDYLLGRFNS
jgi:hypothetical protein